MFLYTSHLGRHIPLHFTPWQTYSFTLHPLADMFLYTSPLADLFLYTSPPGRPVPLHFTPWQTCSFTLHPLADLFLYTSHLADMFLCTPYKTCSLQHQHDSSRKQILHKVFVFVHILYVPHCELPGTYLYCKQSSGITLLQDPLSWWSVTLNKLMASMCDLLYIHLLCRPCCLWWQSCLKFLNFYTLDLLNSCWSCANSNINRTETL